MVLTSESVSGSTPKVLPFNAVKLNFSVVLFIILSKVVVAFESVNMNSHMKDTEQYSFRPCCFFSSTRWFRIEPG